MVGVLVTVIAAMYIRLGAEYWIWIALLTIYLFMVVLFITKFRSVILPIVESMTLMAEVLVSSFAVVTNSFRYLFDPIMVLLNNLASILSMLANEIMQFFRRR